MGKARSYSINNSTVNLIFGDLLTSEADVMVISGCLGLPMLGGLPQETLKKAGDAVRTDAGKHTDSKLGDIVVTTAGRLPNKYIFHALTVTHWQDVLPHLSADETNGVCEFIIGHAISKSLQLLATLDLSSIAFPCLGLGMGNMPVESVAKTFAQTISRFLGNTNKVYNIDIYIRDTYNVYDMMDYVPFFEWFKAYSINAGKIEESDEADEAETWNYDDVVVQDVSHTDTIPRKIFISYSRKDSDKARGICDVLNKLGVSYWIDIDGIYSGANFKEIIVKAIEAAEIVLFLSSKDSNQSPNVAKEIAVADKYGKVIIPAHLDDSPLNPQIDYDLAGIDFVDLSTFDENHLGKLRNAILGHLAMNRTNSPAQCSK